MGIKTRSGRSLPMATGTYRKPLMALAGRAMTPNCPSSPATAQLASNVKSTIWACGSVSHTWNGARDWSRVARSCCAHRSISSQEQEKSVLPAFPMTDPMVYAGATSKSDATRCNKDAFIRAHCPAIREIGGGLPTQLSSNSTSDASCWTPRSMFGVAVQSGTSCPRARDSLAAAENKSSYLLMDVSFGGGQLWERDCPAIRSSILR